jgi:hypothetical protein
LKNSKVVSKSLQGICELQCCVPACQGQAHIFYFIMPLCFKFPLNSSQTNINTLRLLRLYLRRRGIKSVSQETSAIKRNFKEANSLGLIEIHIKIKDLLRGSLHDSNSYSGGLLKDMTGSMNVLWR